MAMTPLPRIQMLVLSCVVFVEPVSLMILYPFMYQMVRDFKIADTDEQVSTYAGILAASFSFSQFLTSFMWGRLSDRVGRRPIILLGLFGTGVCSIAFGLSGNYVQALVVRSVCGLVNGNVPVAKCMLGEMTDSTNRDRAFSTFGFTFGLGSLVAPVLGGLLADPASNFPQLFGGVELFQRFPYLLPCAVSGLFSLLGFVVGYFYLEETRNRIPPSRHNDTCDKDDTCETSALLVKVEDAEVEQNNVGNKQPIYPPLMAITAYTMLCLSSIVYQEIFIFWCYTDSSTGSGLNWASQQTGIAMSVAGAWLLVAQTLIYPPMARLFGNHSLFKFAVFASAPLYFVTGFISTVAVDGGAVLIWSLVIVHAILRVTLQVFAFTASIVMVNNSARSSNHLGTINGIGQTCAAFVRAVGPAGAGLLWTFSLQNTIGYPFNYHFTFILVALLSILQGIHSIWIPRHIQ